MLKIKYLTILFILISFIGKSQVTEEPGNVSLQNNFVKVHSPHKATMFSALVPGLGQVYNKKYWKLPVIYGATGILIYAFNFNNDQYNKYRLAYLDMTANKITEFEGYTDKEILKRLKDSYRRNRDLNVILMGAVYLLNIIDATVDAHLFDYKITDDLSFNVQPSLNKNIYNQQTVGLSLSLKF